MSDEPDDQTQPPAEAIAPAEPQVNASPNRRMLFRAALGAFGALAGIRRAGAQSKATPLPPPEVMGTAPDAPTHNASSPAPPQPGQKRPAPPSEMPSAEVPRRALGKTGALVSAIGVGGHHLGDAATVEEALNIVAMALDYGINFFDNCWEYHNGKSENWLGRGLKGKRDKAFVMTKVCTHGRDAKLGMRMLEESLRRLETDHLDLWQIHAVSFDNDPALAYAKGGILEAMEKAKKQGKVRFTGFTGHKDPAFHLEMLRRGYPFDAIQMPLNPMDAQFFSFEKQVVPVANQKGVGIIGMKSMGGTADVVKQNVLTAQDCLRYAMSLPVATTVTGIDSLAVLQQNAAVARGFKPLLTEQLQALRDKCAKFAGDGRFELYKVSIKYDNPETRAPHGFPFDKKLKETDEILEGDSALPAVDTARAPQ